jgi:hypothetical protein
MLSNHLSFFNYIKGPWCDMSANAIIDRGCIGLSGNVELLVSLEYCFREKRVP